MLQLFGSYTSPFVRHCRIAMLQEEAPFEFVPTDFDQSGTMSPAKRVPFLKGDGLFLTDSSAILHYVRTQAGKPFFASSKEANLYFLATTALDTGINLFLLEKDGLTQSSYLARQNERMSEVFKALNDEISDWDKGLDDGILRLACLLTWVAYRDRFDFSHLDRLVALDKDLAAHPLLQETAPPPL